MNNITTEDPRSEQFRELEKLKQDLLQARGWLLPQSIQDRLFEWFVEKERMTVMEQNVKVLQQRASTVETLLQRAVGAKTAAAAATAAGSSSSLDDITSSSTFALNKQDPLLKKFQDIGID